MVYNTDENLGLFAASLPHTKDVICLSIHKKRMELIIYCDDAIAANAMMRAVKSIIMKA